MSNSRKPTLEKVNAEFGSSFSFKHYNDPTPAENPPFWHFHPEIELVYVNGGSGKRHIGNHLSYYQSGDLLLIGSMLPHTGFTDRLSGNESETVIQFNENCFSDGFFDLIEMQDVKQLLQRAKSGIVFTGITKNNIGHQMEELASKNRFEKMIGLLKILQNMAKSTEYEILNADGYTIEVENSDNDRINVIYNYVQSNFERAISLSEISDVASMTVPSFCRYFKRISGKKFTRFVNEIRIVNACKLLTEKQLSILDISHDSGFNNISHFNRLFKDITGKSPSAYRKQFVTVLQEVE